MLPAVTALCSSADVGVACQVHHMCVQRLYARPVPAAAGSAPVDVPWLVMQRIEQQHLKRDPLQLCMVESAVIVR